MSLFQNIVIILLLIVGAGFLSLTEIALAGARKVKLKILAESGDERAQKVLDLQENSADFFAASQIGLNAVAILGGILGDVRWVYWSFSRYRKCRAGRTAVAPGPGSVH